MKVLNSVLQVLITIVALHILLFIVPFALNARDGVMNFLGVVMAVGSIISVVMMFKTSLPTKRSK